MIPTFTTTDRDVLTCPADRVIASPPADDPSPDDLASLWLDLGCGD